MKALIDGDIVVYSCGFAAQKNVWSVEYQSPEGAYVDVEYDTKKEADKAAEEVGGAVVKTVIAEPLENALNNVNSLLERIRQDTLADSYEIYLTGKDNFRDSAVDYYKKNRDPDLKPVRYTEIKDFLINRWGAKVIDGQEADDAMGIEQMRAPSETCICTIDKDLNMIPGAHYNWSKPDDGITYVNEQEGMEFFYQQLLTGDSVDNIPGLFKLTGQRATKKLKAALADIPVEKVKWEYLVKLYNKEGEGVGEDKVIEIARLLWIRRKEGEIWIPPTYRDMFTEEELEGA